VRACMRYCQSCVCLNEEKMQITLGLCLFHTVCAGVCVDRVCTHVFKRQDTRENTYKMCARARERSGSVCLDVCVHTYHITQVVCVCVCVCVCVRVCVCV